MNHIPAKIIGHWSNLEMLPSQLNGSKWSNCSITEEQLFENYRLNLRKW